MTIKLTDNEVALLKTLLANTLSDDEGMGDWNKTSKRILKKLNQQLSTEQGDTLVTEDGKGLKV